MSNRAQSDARLPRALRELYRVRAAELVTEESRARIVAAAEQRLIAGGASPAPSPADLRGVATRTISASAGGRRSGRIVRRIDRTRDMVRAAGSYVRTALGIVLVVGGPAACIGGMVHLVMTGQWAPVVTVAVFVVPRLGVVVHRLHRVFRSGESRVCKTAKVLPAALLLSPARRDRDTDGSTLPEDKGR